MDVMLDIETLGTGKDAAVVQIGAVVFEPLGGGKIRNGAGEVFSCMVDADDALARGATVTMGTLRFWMNESQEARKRVFGPKNLDLSYGPSFEGQAFGSTYQALQWLHQWPQAALGMNWEDFGGVWANGPTFDVSIIEGHYDRFGLPTPWHFSAPRDLRTLLKLPRVGGWPEKMDTTGFVKHHAPDDCVMQIMALQYAMDRLSGR